MDLLAPRRDPPVMKTGAISRLVLVPNIRPQSTSSPQTLKATRLW
jgi:hypothetical protein